MDAGWADSVTLNDSCRRPRNRGVLSGRRSKHFRPALEAKAVQGWVAEQAKEGL